MIDIHHHCLPDVDDGPKSWDDAVAMCRMAADEGIEGIITTPHVLRGLWPRRSLRELSARLRELQERCVDGPALYPGSEYFFSHDMVETLEGGDAILPLAGGRYVLLELPADGVPPMFEAPLYRAQIAGWTPVIAHPERNVAYQSRPQLLADHIARGAKSQVTAGSLVGTFGRAAQAAAELFLERNLVHFIATDAHNLDRRAPRMAQVMEVLRARAGDQRARALTYDNPLAVLENRPLPWSPEPADSRNFGFFTKLRSFFTSKRP